MRKYFIYAVALGLLVVVSPAVQAEDAADGAFQASGLPLPRFVSLAAEEVNARSGPGLRYPIAWVYRKKSLPVEVVREFDHWREIRDRNGDTGWVHKSLLSGERSVIILEERRILRAKSRGDSKPVVRLDPDVIARLEECKPGWCKIRAGEYKGWLRRNEIWGVYKDEQVQ